MTVHMDWNACEVAYWEHGRYEDAKRVRAGKNGPRRTVASWLRAFAHRLKLSAGGREASRRAVSAIER